MRSNTYFPTNIHEKLAHPRCLVTVFGCLFACAIIKWVLGIAVLGRSWPGASLGIALGLATLWKKGWWLYFHPECAALLFISTGTTADVFFGFLLASLVQVQNVSPQWVRFGFYSRLNAVAILSPYNSVFASVIRCVPRIGGLIGYEIVFVCHTPPSRVYLSVSITYSTIFSSDLKLKIKIHYSF